MNSSLELNNLYSYYLTSTNLVNLIANESNIEIRLNLSYVPKDVSEEIKFGVIMKKQNRKN